MEFIIVIGAIGVYFLPSIVGYNKRNAGSIILLNFFLGWTLLGWVIALVWASTVDSIQTPPPYINTGHSTDRIGKLKDLKDLLDRNAITENEYNTEKQKILNQ